MTVEDDHGGADGAWRARLRRVDPAADLHPLPTDRVTEELEHAMSEPVTPAESRRRPGRRRPVALLAAVAAAVVVVAVVVGQTTGGGSVAPTDLALPAAGGPAAACAPVTAESMADNPLAIAAVVSGVADGVVVLDVEQAYRGDPGDQVRIPQQPDLPSELSVGPLQPGQTYLITAVDGQIRTCGQSGPDSPELRAIYQDAFGMP